MEIPKSQTLSTSLEIFSFNIEGLDSILLDPNFKDLIGTHDICLLSETIRGDDSKLNFKCFWDFLIVRPRNSDLGRPFGGITVLVKSGLRSGVKISHSIEGFIWLKMSKFFFHFEQDLYVYSSYIPHFNTSKEKLSKTDYFDDLLTSAKRFRSEGNIIIAGDMNARIGVEDIETSPHIDIMENIIPSFCSPPNIIPRSSCDATVNPNGKKLLGICKNLSLSCANGRTPGDLLGNFTCFTSRGCSAVDLVLANQDLVKCITRLKVLPPEFTSVHSPISFQVECAFEAVATPDKSIPLPGKIIWDPAKAQDLCNDLSSPINKEFLDKLVTTPKNPEVSNDELNICVRTFNDLMNSEARKHMKTSRNSRKKPPKKRKVHHGLKWYNKEYSELKLRLRNISKLLQKNPRDPNIRGRFVKVKKEFRKTVKSAKRAFEVDLIQTLQDKADDPKAFWAFLKGLGNCDKPSASPSSDEWLEHFSNLNSSDPSITCAENERVSNIVRDLEERLKKVAPTARDKLISPIAKEEVEKVIDTLKHGKAVATDLISNDILKATKEIVSPFLVALFNRIIINEVFPEEWSLGIIQPIFKSCDLMDTNCYRGISIISCLSKLFMLILNNRLQTFCDDHNIIHFNQIGFRMSFRPADHVFTMKTLIDQAYKDKDGLYVCFVDFRKAYDTVWRDGLYHKLLNYNVNPAFVRLLRNIYKQSSLAVKTQSGRSSIFASNVGLKQGCNLSPLLFNLFINDFLTEVSMSFTHSPHLEDIPVNALMYADDLVLISKSENGLQNLLNILHRFTKVSPSKQVQKKMYALL